MESRGKLQTPQRCQAELLCQHSHF